MNNPTEPNPDNVNLRPPATFAPDVNRWAEERHEPLPWGFWGTMLFSLLLTICYIGLQVGILLAMFASSGASIESEMSNGNPSTKPGMQQFQALAESGTFLSVQAIAAGVLIPVGCMVFAALRKGITVSEYLGLGFVNARKLLIWLGLGVLVAAVIDTLTWGLGREIVPDFMTNARETSAWLPLLWIGVVIGAPLSEEFFFRGFLLPGLQSSLVGKHGAVVAVAATWAGIHMQYDLFGISSIFLLGLLLGYARVVTNSLWVPIAMHALHNLIATVELELYVRYWPQP